jgi:atypical dual specificity phosphatase
MRICELGDGDAGLAWQQEQQEEEVQASGGGELVRLKAKRALVGAGARVLFYPTLLYNVLRNRFEADFRWWDRVDQVLALPRFCSPWILWLVVFWMVLYVLIYY